MSPSNLALERAAGMIRFVEHGAARLPGGRSAPGRWTDKEGQRL